MRVYIKDFFSKFDLENVDWVTFTEKILNAKFHFLFSA